MRGWGTMPPSIDQTCLSTWNLRPICCSNSRLLGDADARMMRWEFRAGRCSSIACGGTTLVALQLRHPLLGHSRMTRRVKLKY